MMAKKTWIGLSLAAAVLSPALAFASGPLDDVYHYIDAHRGESGIAPDLGKLTLAPQTPSNSNTSAPTSTMQDFKPSPPADPTILTLDSVGAPSLQLHGFLDLRLLTGYLTPRGLYVVNHGVSFQPLGGLVLDLYHSDGFINDISLVVGAWSEYTDHDTRWNELDTFEGINVKFAKQWEFDVTVDQWWFPNSKAPDTEHNLEFKLAFDDTPYLHDFALHPYVNIFWNYTGNSSPVVANALLHKNDNTMYAEFGIGPSYTLKAIDKYPITFSLPTYVSIGDSSFWGETPGGSRSNFGVFSTGVKASVPLSFIPSNFGNWSAYVGFTYINTLNPALSYVNQNVLGDSHDTNRMLGYMGVSMGF